MELCVALDLPTTGENIALAKMLKSYSIWLKIGFRTYIRDGKSLINKLKSINPNFKIFLDLKLYDIPNTMADASEEIAHLGIDMFNIHASAGDQAMKMVMDRISKYKNRPKIIAVTALTSFDNQKFENIYGGSIANKANQFAKMSHKNGLDGVVCSVFESLDIKNSTSDSFMTICPGIRPFGENTGDQKRVATLEKTHEEKADIIVVGRPIYNSNNPSEVTQKILSFIGQK